MIPGPIKVAVVLLLCAAPVGCQSTGPRLTAEQKKIREEVNSIRPWDYACARESPILDIHTHTFNARYLPLRGVLQGKRDAFPPLTWLISDSCAATLAHSLIERTELARAGGQKAIARSEVSFQAHQHHSEGWLCGVFLRLLDKAAVKGAWRKGMSAKRQMEAIDAVATDMNMFERTAIMAATHMMGMEHQVDMSTNGLRGAVRFLWLLTQNDARMQELYEEQLEGTPMAGEPLMVSHMMDLAPVYNQFPDSDPPRELLKFEAEQLPRMEEFQRRPGSNMIYFVAYNPYRDYWGRGERRGSLEVVERAIKRHGAWGVKVYPPSGYRPGKNKIKDRPSGIRSHIAAEQYDARYGPLPEDKSDALNRKLERLLEWCDENDVPVFVHAGTGEFEAQKGYGLYHSNPSFWEGFLEKHPTLRLCFGHAGGGDYWFGGKHATEWGDAVYRMCRKYPNVYCEITAHAELISENRRAFFVDRLATKFGKKNDGLGAHDFSTKLIYGTDWYLPDASNRDAVLLATQQAFLWGKLRDHYRDYFFGNALRYLNVEKELSDPAHKSSPVDARLRQALALSRSTQGDPCKP